MCKCGKYPDVVDQASSFGGSDGRGRSYFHSNGRCETTDHNTWRTRLLLSVARFVERLAGPFKDSYYRFYRYLDQKPAPKTEE